MMKKNTLIELKIEDMNNLGNGVAHSDGFAVFVPGGVTGDTVIGKIIKVTKSYAVARIEEILSPSPYRTTERNCRYHKRCGGCIYRNISRDYELEIKRNTVISSLRRAGISDISVEETVTDTKSDRYRNKAQYPLSKDKDGNINIGFFSQKSHDVIDIDDCLQLPEIFTRISLLFRDYVKNNSISVYDENSGTGLVRHLYLRTSQTESISMCVVINGNKLPDEDGFVKHFTDAVPEISGISVNTNTRNTNVILGDSYRTLWGAEYLEDTMCGLNLRLSPASFYQVNRNVAEKLYSIAADKAGLSGEETLLDLFCGAGTIGLSMAHRVKRLFGVDIVPDAIENARYNAGKNGITNAQFTVADAADGEGLFSAAKRALGDDFYASVIILDPPRKGCTRELLTAVAQHAPERIVYISCNPDTLARDIVILRELGYDTSSVTPVDMFPGTGHVESVCLLSKVSVR
ncbi:MAG: 23S rRNA (uracil(1939)-C(5))-methyltransferase RlmD [Clostridia bacterium]|nr:23S rRNA (uracil(1939)-C(5))-methyltransferase RlmD [Clostridia bacterium]